MNVKDLTELLHALQNSELEITAESSAVPGVYLLSEAYSKTEDADPIEGFLKKSLDMVGLSGFLQAKKNIFALPFDPATIKIQPDERVILISKHVLDAVTFLPNSDKLAEIVQLSKNYTINFIADHFVFVKDEV